MIRVLVISPTPALRVGLHALLSSDPDLAVTSAAALADLPPERAGLSIERPEVVVAAHGSLDLGAPGLLAEQSLLLVTEDAQELQALAGLELRAWGAISPESTAEALQAAVHALAGGLSAASPALLRLALAPGPGNGLPALPGLEEDGDAPIDPLTERETDVLLRLAQGLTNKQIALALTISEHTVKFHVSSIYSKLGVSNRTEAVRKATRRGWIPL